MGTQEFVDKWVIGGDARRNQAVGNLKGLNNVDCGVVSDVPPHLWGTQEPSYTGNDITPYINQIVPSVKLDAQYVEDVEISDDGIYYNGTQTLTVTVTPEVVAELINIYAEQMDKASSVLFKSLEFTASVQVVRCTGTITGASQNFTFSLANVESDPLASMAGKSYETVKAAAAAQSHTFVVNHNRTRVSRGLNMLVAVFVNNIKIGDVVLKYNNANVDYAAISGTATRSDILVDSAPGGTIPGTPGVPGGGFVAPATWYFPAAGSSASISAYANWEVADPRCNLESEYWISDNEIGVGNADNLGSANSNATYDPLD